MRGDNFRRPVNPPDRFGSPPHAWGQLPSIEESLVVKRFTPTCVGTTMIQYDHHHRSTVHPHMRGDNFIPEELNWIPYGSPPHAWGQLNYMQPI